MIPTMDLVTVIVAMEAVMAPDLISATTVKPIQAGTKAHVNALLDMEESAVPTTLDHVTVTVHLVQDHLPETVMTASLTPTAIT